MAHVKSSCAQVPADMPGRERYLLEALQAVASYGKGETANVVLRPYMEKHGIRWDDKEDIKTWMQRIAQDAIDHALKVS